MKSICSGGGGIPINGTLPLSVSDVKYIDSNGAVMLRSGSLENDIASYPDSTSFSYGNPTLDTSFAVSSGNTDGVAVNTTHIYSLNNTANIVEVYDKITYAFVTSFSIAEYSNDIAVDDTHVYISEAYNIPLIYKFTLTGVFVDSFPVTEGETAVKGVTVDDTTIYVIGTTIDKLIEYNKSDYSFIKATALEYQNQLAIDDAFLYVIVDKIVYVYKKTLDYPFSYSFNIYTEGDALGEGFDLDDNKMYLADRNGTDSIRVRNNPSLHVGLIQEATDQDTGLPIYIRIK